jgi:DNA-directed RNA polymerase specialized sigma24 family protein
MNDLADRLYRETTLTRQQATVVAGRVDGRSYQAIADEMDVSRGTAHKHGERARQKAEEAQQTVDVLQEVGFISGDR